MAAWPLPRSNHGNSNYGPINPPKGLLISGPPRVNAWTSGVNPLTSKSTAAAPSSSQSFWNPNIESQKSRPAPIGSGRASTSSASPSKVEPLNNRQNYTLKKLLKPYINDAVHSKPENMQSKQGTSGTRVTLSANYYRLVTKNKFLLYQYAVDFLPEINVTSLRKLLLYAHKKHFGNYLYDGTCLYLMERLERDLYDLVSMVEHSNEVVKLSIRFTNVVDSDSAPAMQILNIIVRKAMAGLNLQLVGRNFYDSSKKKLIPEFGLQLWPGFLTSIRQHETDVLLCAEPIFKVMRDDTIFDLYEKFRRDHRDYAHEEFKRAVVGTTVLTDYNNKLYRIDDVDFVKTPMSTFVYKNSPISYYDYYRQRYNIKIQHRNQPILISYTKPPHERGQGNDLSADLIPELSRTTGITSEMEKNMKLMTEMSKIMRVSPGIRRTMLDNYNRQLANSPESMAVLKNWGMTLENKLIQVPGRILPASHLILDSNKRYLVDDNVDWARNLTDKKLLETCTLKNWCFLMPKRCNIDNVISFIDTLIWSARNIGIAIAKPTMEYLVNDTPEVYNRSLETCINRYCPQLVMVLLSNRNRTQAYSVIKRKTIVDRDVPSQVVVESTIRPSTRLKSIASKIAVQLNCKLGAIPWNIELPIRANMLVIGFDVNHDTKTRKASYGAMVATIHNGPKMEFFSCISKHDNGEELSNHMGVDSLKALNSFIRHHRALPDMILFYRDGVGDGQLPYVLEQEVTGVTQQLSKIYKEHNKVLRLAYIVVNKRLNTRIFDGTRNPAPGTVVDNVITLPQRYDFFLISQKINQGTVSPTSYNIIYDTTGLKPDTLQLMTYKLCHLYYNWAGTTRIPSVCQYAHKLAFLIGQYVHSQPNRNLDSKLYFL